MRSDDPARGEVFGSGPVEVRLAAGPRAAVVARAAVARGMAGHVADDVLADAQLLVSELVSNSIRHAGLGADAMVRVGATISDGMLRLEVDDAGTAGEVAARAPDLNGGGGFGLRIVETLSERWGVSRDGHTRVWAELVCWPSPP
jgi:serine/threonine-protein kinase RsbW